LGVSCFFIKKPNGGLRLCIEYHGLNNVTYKNILFLSLLTFLIALGRPSFTLALTSLMCITYVVCIKAREKWKTTSHCKSGLFEYSIFPFGLMSTPAAFQIFMNCKVSSKA
jgi:hypothetical protein